jgi:hypothetical protein
MTYVGKVDELVFPELLIFYEIQESLPKRNKRNIASAFRCNSATEHLNSRPDADDSLLGYCTV